MRYGAIKKRDIANGPGVRVVLFVSGCTHHCKGCFQPQTWDFNYGDDYTADTEQEIIDALAPDFMDGLTLLGGEPFEPDNNISLQFRGSENQRLIDLPKTFQSGEIVWWQDTTK